jgi:flagellar FliJ protein
LKKFSFRLQSILDLKEQEEESIKKELAELMQQRQRVEDKINSFKHDKSQIQRNLEESEEESVNLINALRSREYIKYLQGMIEDLKLKLEHWDEEISKCRKKLLAKTKEKKVLAKLKERKHEEYWKNFLAEEQKLNDELATNKFNRKEKSLDGLI